MTAYTKALGDRLRDVRQRAGLSLQQVELKSEGRWKAIVVGSYERADRAVTVQKLAGLAHFYGVALQDLLPPDGLINDDAEDTPIVLNLERLKEHPTAETEPLAHYVAEITRRRGTQQSLLPVRSSDLDSLAQIYNTSVPELVARFVSWGVLSAGAAPH